MSSKAESQYTREFYLKEIDLIQNIINRMSNNSFLIKGWALTLVVGSMVLSTDPQHRLYAFLPCIAFWYLDVFYLQSERHYRKLYEWVIINRPNNKEKQFDLNAKGRFGKDVSSKLRIMFSDSILPFYGTIFLLILLINWNELIKLIYLYLPKPI